MANDNIEEKSFHPDRPLECSECKRPITVHYTQIIGTSHVKTGMCAECPQLQRHLKGSSIGASLYPSPSDSKTGVVCGECGTTLDEIRMGRAVGCSQCYEVFDRVLLDELIAANKISQSITKKKKSVPLHVGRSPGQMQEISPSLRLIALNEALEDTLKKEDYEQAAWLRDQIKALTGEEETEEKK